MSNRPKTSKRQVGLRIELTLCRQVEKKYLRENDEDKSVAYIRALEDSTREIILTPADLEAVAAEMRKNELKRKLGKSTKKGKQK